MERILATSYLSKSARLTELFQYLCMKVLDEDAQEIHELELGHKVFGRPSRYDTTADNIVRVHASLLRKRLSEYFLNEGCEEEFQVEIPRGNYAPIFRRREVTPFDAEVLELNRRDGIAEGIPIYDVATIPAAPAMDAPGTPDSRPKTWAIVVSSGLVDWLSRSHYYRPSCFTGSNVQNLSPARPIQ